MSKFKLFQWNDDVNIKLEITELLKEKYPAPSGLENGWDNIPMGETVGYITFPFQEKMEISMLSSYEAARLDNLFFSGNRLISRKDRQKNNAKIAKILGLGGFARYIFYIASSYYQKYNSDI